MSKEKSEYIAFPDDIKRATDWENYRKAIDLPFWMEALYDAGTNYLALYGKDYEITKVTLCNLWEANSRLLYYLPKGNEKRKIWIRMKKVLERESREITKGEYRTKK